MTPHTTPLLLQPSTKFISTFVFCTYSSSTLYTHHIYHHHLHYETLVTQKKKQNQTHKKNIKQKEYIPSAGSGLGVGSEGAAGEKNMHDAEFTCALFRFIQLTCEGHNLGI